MKVGKKGSFMLNKGQHKGEQNLSVTAALYFPSSTTKQMLTFYNVRT